MSIQKTASRKSRSSKKHTASAKTIELMYERMVIARTIETIMMNHTRTKPFSGWWHPGEGQEAAGIGATAALKKDDYVWYQGRGSSWAIGKGMDPAPILGDLLGRTTGSTKGKGGGIPHWSDRSIGVMGEGATLGSVYPLAAGSALASKMRKDGRVSLANFGDGTASRGTFHETLVHAAAWKLPLIYFCENNGYLVGTKITEVCPTENIADFAHGYGIPGVIVDGQDAQAVYEATSEAAERARNGGGPTLIEAKVIRRQGHYAGDPQTYRDLTELDSYRDPVEVLAADLKGNAAERLFEKAKNATEAAYEAAQEAPVADASILYKDLYYE